MVNIRLPIQLAACRTIFTVIGTLAVDWWAVTFGTATRDLGGLRPRPAPSSLYQMQQPTHQQPVYQLRVIRSFFRGR